MHFFLFRFRFFRFGRVEAFSFLQALFFAIG
jgi:hypothetical protein